MFYFNISENTKHGCSLIIS